MVAAAIVAAASVTVAPVVEAGAAPLALAPAQPANATTNRLMSQNLFIAPSYLLTIHNKVERRL